MDSHRRTAASTPRRDSGPGVRPRRLGSIGGHARAVLGLTLALLAPVAGAGPQAESTALADWNFAADYELWAAERTEAHAEPFRRWYNELERERQRAGVLEGLEAQALTTCAVALTEALPAWRKLPLTGLELAERAVETAAVLDLSWQGFAEEALSEMRLKSGHVQDNIDHLEWVIEDYRFDAPDRWLNLGVSLADSYRHAGRAAETFDLIGELRLSVARAQITEGNRALLTLRLTGIEGMAYLDLGVVDQASRCFDAYTQRVQGPLAHPKHRALDYIQRASLLMGTSRNAEACALLDEALGDASLSEFHGGFLTTQGLLNAVFEKEGLQPAGAARAKLLAAQALPLSERKSLRVQLGLAELDLRRGRDLADVTRRLEATEQQITRTFGAQGLDFRSQLAVLRARLGVAREESDAQLEEYLAQLEEVFEDLLAEWDAAPRRAGGLGFLRYAARQAVPWEIAALSLRLRGPEAGARAAISVMMRARSRSSVVRSLGGEAPEFAGLALGTDAVRTVREQLLRPGQGALVYMPGDVGRSLVIAIDHQSIEAIALPPPWVWRQATKELQQRLRLRLSIPALAAQGSGYEDLTQVLSGALLPPAVQQRLASWTAVTIVGRDLAGQAPFELLPLDGRGPLGLELAVDYLPSLFLGCVLARRARAPEPRAEPGTRLTVLVAPTESADSPFAPIPWSDAEAAAWRAAYGAEAVRTYTGPEASAAVLARPATADSDILHLIVHGDSEGTWEHPAALVLAASEEHPTGRLWAEDIVDLALPELVVLSVCGAARGPERIGDDLAGNLGGALLRAGANAAVLSSNDLEYGATLVLMDEFHRGIAVGRSPAEAMLAGRRSLSQHPTYSDPVHWAVVHVTGLGHRPLFEAPPPTAAGPDAEGHAVPRAGVRSLGFGGLALVLAVLAYLLWRRRSLRA